MKPLGLPRGVYAMLLALACLFVAFVALDLYGMLRITRYLKFASVVLCLAIAMFWNAQGSGGKALLRAALLLTVCADACLLLFDAYTAGVLFFIAVQTLYCIRHGKGGWKTALALLAAAIIAAVLGGAALGLGGTDSGRMYLASAVYAVMLAASVCKVINAYRRGRFGRVKTMCISAGMLLFLFCDACVGAYNALLALQGPSRAADAFVIACWIFYLPSQVLLALSGVVQDNPDMKKAGITG